MAIEASHVWSLITMGATARPNREAVVEVAMPKASTYQCPSCGGVLSYEVETGLLTCEFCDSSFHEGEVEKSIPVSSTPVEVQETDHVKTVEEFLQHAPWQTENPNSIGYLCPSCGASVVADQSAVTATCPFCSNNMVVSGIATEQNVPQWVLPFSLTQEQAKEEMLKHFEKKWYLSRQFQASIEHMQGVYVPYHLYDMRASGSADYIGMYVKSSRDNETRYYFAVHRAGYERFEKIPVDGSSKMPDAHMDAIAPFNLSEMREFSTSYVAGYLTEVPDESAETCLPRAEERAVKTFEDGLKSDVLNGHGMNSIDQVVAHETNIELEGVSSCVLPVWLAHCTWNDEQMLFAVNGETGKCVGDLPIDGKRRAVTVCIVALVLLVIAVLFSAFYAGGTEDRSFTTTLIASLVGVAVVTLFVDFYFQAQMKSAVESHDADESQSAEGLVVTQRWQSNRIGRKSKAREALEEFMQQRE